MAINVKSPSTFTTSVLIGDAGVNPATPTDSVPSLTKVNGIPVAAALELQSIQGALLLPRMTSAQINALNNANTAITDGMVAYDTDLGAVVSREGGAWSQSFSSVNINITAAQFNGMYANPIQLMPPPGAGKLILVNLAVLELQYNAPQFNNGGDVIIQYGNVVHGAGPAAAGGPTAAVITALNATTILGMASSIFLNQNGIASANAVNTGLFLSNNTAPYAAGASNFSLTIYYTIVRP